MSNNQDLETVFLKGGKSKDPPKKQITEKKVINQHIINKRK